MIIIAESVVFRLHAFIVSWDFNIIPNLWTNLCSKPYKVRRQKIYYTNFNGL